MSDKGTDNQSTSTTSSWLGHAKKGLATFFNVESAKNKVVAHGSPLLMLIPGVGPLLASGIGAGAGTLSKIQKYVADSLIGEEAIDPHVLADMVITDAKEKVPGLLAQADIPNIKLG